MALVLTVLITAFLLGSIPFGFLLYRLATGGDIRRTGSGNIGATNVLRSGGRRLGALTLALDASKGALAVAVALHWAPPAAPWAALVVIVGHMYSPWLSFRGGKGVATALGAFAVLTPWALLAAVVVFALVFAGWRYVSLASIAACVGLALVLLIPALGPPGEPATPALQAVAVAAALLIIARHRANIGRLWRGTESSFGRAAGGDAHGAAK
jgi:glycerol-3-phosphate acyltransferase PlsY